MLVVSKLLEGNEMLLFRDGTQDLLLKFHLTSLNFIFFLLFYSVMLGLCPTNLLFFLFYKGVFVSEIKNTFLKVENGKEVFLFL